MPVSETLSLPPEHEVLHMRTWGQTSSRPGLLGCSEAPGTWKVPGGMPWVSVKPCRVLGRTDPRAQSEAKCLASSQKAVAGVWGNVICPEGCRKLEAWAGKTPSPSGRYNSSCATTSSLHPSPSLSLSSDTQRRRRQRAPCCSTVGLPHEFTVHLWCGGDTAVTRAVMPPRSLLIVSPQNSAL